MTEIMQNFEGLSKKVVFSKNSPLHEGTVSRIEPPIHND